MNLSFSTYLKVNVKVSGINRAWLSISTKKYQRESMSKEGLYIFNNHTPVYPNDCWNQVNAISSSTFKVWNANQMWCNKMIYCFLESVLHVAFRCQQKNNKNIFQKPICMCDLGSFYIVMKIFRTKYGEKMWHLMSSQRPIFTNCCIYFTTN